MKKLLLSLALGLALLAVPCSVTATTRDDLLDAMRRGVVKIYVQGTGSSARIQVDLVESAGSDRYVTIPVGTVIAPRSTGTVQRLSVVTSALVYLPAYGRRTQILQTACLDIALPPPGHADKSYLVYPPDFRVARLVALMDEAVRQDASLQESRQAILQCLVWRNAGATRTQLIHHVQHYSGSSAATAASFVDQLLPILDDILQAL